MPREEGVATDVAMLAGVGDALRGSGNCGGSVSSASGGFAASEGWGMTHRSLLGTPVLIVPTTCAITHGSKVKLSRSHEGFKSKWR